MKRRGEKGRRGEAVKRGRLAAALRIGMLALVFQFLSTLPAYSHCCVAVVQLTLSSSIN